MLHTSRAFRCCVSLRSFRSIEFCVIAFQTRTRCNVVGFKPLVEVLAHAVHDDAVGFFKGHPPCHSSMIIQYRGRFVKVRGKLGHDLLEMVLTKLTNGSIITNIDKPRGVIV